MSPLCALVFLCLLALGCAAVAPVPPTASAAQPFVWPLPQSFSAGSTLLTLSPQFAFQGTPSFADLDTLFSWVSTFTFDHEVGESPTGATVLPSLTVTVTNQDADLQIGVDESYTLFIPDDGSAATLTAGTYYGAVNGLQTFSQLVVYNFTTQTFQVADAPIKVVDKPRYAHRGLLMDTSRHFQPVSVLKKLVDSLSFAKFNVLHWHIVDTQSFPFESKRFPKLWAGAYSQQEKYTQRDVQALVEYARLRNVRVMVEFDTPGHAASWCVGYPEICPSPTCQQPLNPATEATFDLLSGLFEECTGGAPGKGLFPSSMVHLGGDEVDTSCWTKTPAVASWLQQRGFTADQAYYYFVNRTLNILIDQGHDPVNWEEVYNHFGTKLNPKAIVHAWYNKPTVAVAVKDGYRTLNSDGWYLDHLGDLWTTYYNNDPMENITNPQQQALVLGGECCMWGETVDPSDLFSTVWPRAAAVAERLWSDASVTDTTAAQPRYGTSAACSRAAVLALPQPRTHLLALRRLDLVAAWTNRRVGLCSAAAAAPP
eukprot:CAMPEP_0177650472 /NCGR_PEP_ID=MMETSP0447-20121125/11962_1 /TAXON_ID=0 /ORGANISM="Stygamoeba regulata, Strain BSH-02190019" /LENGTH=539 /DNA_ID=CAMNT_0019153347 /DNA_START=6 /DNA_END=1623 /DNA_ORIENTATION=-